MGKRGCGWVGRWYLAAAHRDLSGRIILVRKTSLPNVRFPLRKTLETIALDECFYIVERR